MPSLARGASQGLRHRFVGDLGCDFVLGEKDTTSFKIRLRKESRFDRDHPHHPRRSTTSNRLGSAGGCPDNLHVPDRKLYDNNAVGPDHGGQL